jgi:hypothetical protein
VADQHVVKIKQQCCLFDGYSSKNYLVEHLHCVGAVVTLAQVATVAWPPCLGAGAVVQGAGGSHQAEVAEVHAGLHCIWLFTAPTPCGGCASHGQGVAHVDHLLCDKHVFPLVVSSIHSGGSAMGNWLQQQQPLIVVLRCTLGTGTCQEFRRRV